jgi:DNA-directed RNA polymerase subunit N (RpoN/RPB10)
MFIAVVCFTCGSPIGDVAELFERLRSQKVAAGADGIAAGATAKDAAPVVPGYAPVPGYDPAIYLKEKLAADCLEIFEKLQIDSDCCRMHLATAANFSDYN